MLAKTTKKSNTIWYILGSVVLGILLAVLLINKMPPNASDNWFYETGACTWNGNRTCPGFIQGGWDGVCTDEIGDECCTSIRECEGTTSNPFSCLDKYCYEAGNKCTATLTDDSDLQNLIYTCECIDVETGLSC